MVQRSLWTLFTHTHTQSIFWRKSSDFKALEVAVKKKIQSGKWEGMGCQAADQRFHYFLMRSQFSMGTGFLFLSFFLRKKARLPRWCYVRQVKSEVHNPLAQRLDTGQIVLQISSCLGDRHIEGWAAVQCSFHILPSKRSMGTPWTLQCDRVLSHRPSLSIELDSCAPLGQGCHC